MFQAKLVNPNGSPKAIVATHDRVASGKEFALFSQLLGMMALGSIPDDTFTPSGYQMSRLIKPEELVRRAELIVREAMNTSEANGWTQETVDIDQIYDDAAGTPAGFRPSSSASNLDDTIPF